MAEQHNLQEQLLQHIEAVFYPIKMAATDSYHFKVFARQLGWDFDEIENFPISNYQSLLADIADLVDEVTILVQNPPQSIGDFIDCLQIVGALMDLIASIDTFLVAFPSIPASLANEFSQTGKDIVNYLICGYLVANYPIFYHSLSLIGIIDPFEVVGYTEAKTGTETESWQRHPFLKSEIHLERLKDLIQDPVAYFKSIYYPTTGVITNNVESKEFSDKFFPRLSLLLTALDFYSVYGSNVEDAQYFNPDVFEELSRTFSFRAFPDQDFDFGASLSVSETPNGIFGLILKLFGEYNFEKKVGNWYVNGILSALSDALSVDKQGVTFPTTFTGNSLAVNTSIYRISGEGTKYLLGSTNGTRLAINEILFNFFLSLQQGNTKYGADLFLNGTEFFLSGGDGDSFLNKIIPGGIGGKFDLNIGWDNIGGVRFGASGGLDILVPSHIKLGPLELNGLKLAIRVQNEEILVTAGATAKVDFGVIVADIDNFGLRANFSFPSSGGNLGICNVDFNFKPPNGVALAINAGPVKGAGFLDYNASTSTYTGGLELTFSKISFSAIGIISTKLPGGKEGYSLLIIITAEFSPIQLGMGFTLNGLGGLLGLNRGMNPDVLRTGLRDKTLDSILFPKDIINNKDTIISNIGQAFPVMEGQFMVGPMAKIGWGTPTLITIELGIILEFPEPVRLAILGVLRAILPSEDKAVLKLQINFLGIIDFTAKYLSFDASIYDSKILTFPLMGDMALRLYWGDKPNFLMSVGGFHPRYTPPPLNLPELRRLSLMLANEKNFKIGVEAYFAVSSNSVQFGAKVAAEARMWDGKINVLGALWFDILFKFNPFYFAADMGAQFAVRWKSKELLSIFINLMLEGPNPWRAQGKGTFKVIGIGVTVSFDKTFGKVVAETIAPVGLDDKFAEQLAHKDNWEALLPPRSHQQILWKEAAAAEGLIVDTGGQLRFSQKLLPLNIDMARFGTAPISDTKRFEITSYKLVQSGQTEPFNTPAPAKDLFARSEYFNMTDDDKLSKDPYESFESGVFIGSDKISSDYAVHRKVEYEDIVIDTGFREQKTNKWSLAPELMQVHLLDSYVSKSALSDFTVVGNNAGPKKVAAVNIVEERFVVVDSNNLNIVSQVFTSSAEADSFLNAQMQSNSTANGWFVANEFELV